MWTFLKKIVGKRVVRRSRALAGEFLDMTRQARRAQEERLLALVRRNADSAFGRDHHFHEIRNAADFRRRVPIRGYDGHEPYIDRVRNGDIGALFGPGTQVLMFAMTSGTTARPKTIPVTEESLKNYRDGWTIWGIRAFDDHPVILEQGLMPILQLASDWKETTTAAGIPCGAITGLTASMQNRLVRTTYCMHAAASRIKDVRSKYYTALRLSAYRNVGTTIAANPSTMLGIARLGDIEKECLIRDLFQGTLDAKWDVPPDVRKAIGRKVRKKRKDAAKRLEAIVEEHGTLYPQHYWPELQFLANWTGGSMGAYLHDYPKYFGDRPVRDPGLIASEGRMSIPIEDNTPAGVLDIRHQYFEFLPEDQLGRDNPETVAAADLIEGREYFILPTTAGGLYRYQIHDLVRCVGFHNEAPVIAFLNKGAHISSLTGEKLSEFQVVEASNRAQKALGVHLTAFLLLPTWGDPPHYTLLVELPDLKGNLEAADRLATAIDGQLQAINCEYENKRSTQRLGPVRIRLMPGGAWADFQRRRLAKSGGTVEQYKQPCLLPDLEALATFPEVTPESASARE
ncbi:MAG: GH3 auxin-responsive promoter family protein [Isosphaeraceae bacterium]